MFTDRNPSAVASLVEKNRKERDERRLAREKESATLVIQVTLFKSLICIDRKYGEAIWSGQGLFEDLGLHIKFYIYLKGEI